MRESTSTGQTVNGLTFEQWKREVNRAAVKLCGLSADDLPDAAYWDCWNAGQTAASMAREVIASSMEEMGYDPDELLDD